MKEKKLNAISPIDGRYRDKVDSISKYFSEKALIYYRLKVEIEYFLALSDLKLHSSLEISVAQRNRLKTIFQCEFNVKLYTVIK